MALRIPLAVLAVFCASCGGGEATPSAETLSAAREELERRGIQDQAVREGFAAGGVIDTAQIRVMMSRDSANAAWLGDYVSRWGWPTSEQVGREAVDAAFFIAQHAIHDLPFMREMLPHIQDAYRRGDLSGEEVAMLTDRVEVKSGRPQIYGTQLSMKDGRWVLDPMADSAGVDERRRQMGMVPLSEYLRLVDSVTASPPVP